MKSIGSSIQTMLVVSISIVAITAVALLAVNLANSLRNQRLIDTMTTEYSIISLSNNLVQAYDAAYTNAANTQFADTYEKERDTLLTILASLKNRVTQPESAILLAGVDHTVNQVIRQCDEGIAEIRHSDFSEFSDHYAQANKDNEFVQENTRVLVEKELEYLYASQQSNQRLYYVLLAVTAGVFLSVIGGILLFSRTFTNRLILPLTQLTHFAKEVAGGNTQAQPTFQVANDEIGSLADSIKIMVSKLVGTVDEQQKANEEIRKATETLKEKNDELAKMNALMIGREIKMTELKKEIEELKKQLHPMT